jgi:hypothetical protein
MPRAEESKPDNVESCVFEATMKESILVPPSNPHQSCRLALLLPQVDPQSKELQMQERRENKSLVHLQDSVSPTFRAGS